MTQKSLGERQGHHMRSVVQQSATVLYIGKTLRNIIDAIDCNDLSAVFQLRSTGADADESGADPALRFEDECESQICRHKIRRLVEFPTVIGKMCSSPTDPLSPWRDHQGFQPLRTTARLNLQASQPVNGRDACHNTLWPRS